MPLSKHLAVLNKVLVESLAGNLVYSGTDETATEIYLEFYRDYLIVRESTLQRTDRAVGNGDHSN